MKVGALLCGLMASAFAWAAPFVMGDTGAAFLALWPDGESQQFIGLLVWHGLAALGILGGLLTVLTPMTGTLVLLAGAGGWAVTGLMLPGGFTPEVLVPAGLCGLGALFAFIGAILSAVRRRSRWRDEDDDEDRLQNEDDGRSEPSPAQRRTASLQGIRALRESGAQDAVAEPAPPPALDAEEEDEPEDRFEPEPEPMDSVAPPGRDYAPAAFSAEPRERVVQVIERRGNPVLAALNLIVLLLLLGAVGILLYSEYRSGGLSAALPFLPPSAEVALAGPAAPAVEEIAPAAPAVAEPAVTEPAEPEVRVSTTPLDLADLSTTTWSDPFGYCAAVGTVDAPDRRYDGPAEVPTIVAALPTAARTAPKWRCFDGAVLACTAPLDSACARTPRVGDMLAYCTENPGATGLEAPAGTWSCNGTRPVIPLGQAWPVDGRGFLPTAWAAVPAPAATDGPAG